jgi:hypothetical protein
VTGVYIQSVGKEKLESTMSGIGGAWLGPVEGIVLLAILALATTGTAILFAVALAAYARRRTTVYLLLTLALGLLVGRSVVGFGTALGLVPMPVHHLLEHGSDLALAVIVLFAIYRTGPVDRSVDD